MKLPRYSIPLLIVWLFSSIGFAANESKPNILFIIVDDLGYGDLSSYGATDLKSPRIDELMGEGLRFNQFYANCTGVHQRGHR